MARGKNAMRAGSESIYVAQLLSDPRSARAACAIGLPTSLNRNIVEDDACTIYLALDATLSPSGDLTTGISRIPVDLRDQEGGTRQPRREYEGA